MSIRVNGLRINSATWSVPGTGATVGIFALGNTSGASAIRDKYTFAGDVNSAATSSTAACESLSATGNSTVGIFALGNSPTASTT